LRQIFEIERAASRLRRQLKTAAQPEMRLLCGLQFFGLFLSAQHSGLESYVREFIHSLAEAARKSDPPEFLPEEIDALGALVNLVESQCREAVSTDDLKAFDLLLHRAETDRDIAHAATSKNAAGVTCLFIEHYPDLDLPPRGRSLRLFVTASRISADADQDDIVVRNPVKDADDRFVAQARDSVTALRKFMLDEYRLLLKHRYRFDFELSSRDARFTGDSLGVAFAVGAAAALSRLEVLRERLSVSSRVVLSGALSVDGQIEPIDAEALKLKISRAFHSDIRCLVIPRQHVQQAWEHGLELEKKYPDRKLELIGAESLEDVMANPQVVTRQRCSLPAYAARKAVQAGRSLWVEVPALVILLAVLFVLVAPARWMPWFDDNPEYAVANTHGSSLDVYNADSLLLWSDTLPYPPYTAPIPPGDPAYYTSTFNLGRVRDLNGDGLNEIVFLPRFSQNCPDKGYLRFYSYDGQLLHRVHAGILGHLPADTPGVVYDALYYNIFEGRNKPYVISIVAQERPARAHISIWDTNANRTGWYINFGHAAIPTPIDYDSDGIEELFILGFNNGLKCTALMLLDPNLTEGLSPHWKYSDNPPDWYLPGTQEAYSLFPMTDIGRLPGELGTDYNFPASHGVRFRDDSTLQVHIRESRTISAEPAIIYTFNRRLRVTDAALNDALRKRRRQLVAEGKLSEPTDWAAYKASLRDAVTYWTDSGWVTEGQLRAAENR
jgi:hypothetical protein